MPNQAPPASLAVPVEPLREKPHAKGQNPRFNVDFITVGRAAVGLRLNYDKVVPDFGDIAYSVIANSVHASGVFFGLRRRGDNPLPAKWDQT
jgi:hypothetical protein